MDIIEQKQKLRKEYIRLRKQIKNKEEKSKIIFNKLIVEDEFINSNIVALYNSLDSEVNTNELIKYCLESGKIVLLPRVVDNYLKFYKVNKNDVFVKSSFGVLEPIDNIDNLVLDDNIDLVIVPGICFDLKRNRLGFGKGFYDRVLSNSNLKNIAICFDEQVLNNGILPVNNHDVKVKKIITDKRII